MARKKYIDRRRYIAINIEFRDKVRALAQASDVPMAAVLEGCVDAVVKAGAAADAAGLSPYAVVRELLELRDLFHKTLSQSVAISHELSRRGTSVSALLRGAPIPPCETARRAMEDWRPSHYGAARKDDR